MAQLSDYIQPSQRRRMGGLTGFARLFELIRQRQTMQAAQSTEEFTGRTPVAPWEQNDNTIVGQLQRKTRKTAGAMNDRLGGKS